MTWFCDRFKRKINLDFIVKLNTCLENAESELFSILLRHDSRRKAEFRARFANVPLAAFVFAGTYFSTGR